MKPYYESERGKLFCGDFLEVAPQLKEKFSLCFTDPPYGIGEAAGKNQRRIKKQTKAKGKNTRGTPIPPTNFISLPWDNKPASPEAFEMIYNLSKNQIIFGGNYFAEHLKNSPCWIVWDKDNSGDFADAELIYTSFKSAVRIMKFRWNGMLQENMKYKEKRYHPTQKPVGLLEQILEKYSGTGESVIDPFGGVGSTAVACELRRQPWVVIEKEEKYCEIAAKRIEAATSQKSFEDYL